MEEDHVKLFLQNCLGLIKNEDALHKLRRLLDQCAQESQPNRAKEPKQVDMQEKKVRKVVHRKCTNR